MTYSDYIVLKANFIITTYKMLPIRDMFIAATKMPINGVQGYHVQKKYINSRDEQNQKIKKAQLKRGSYLDDYNKVHGSIPGPGIYNYAKNLWPEKPKHVKPKISEKKTFIDEIMRQCKKQKKPAPGQYKLEKSQKQLEEQKKAYARKKTHVSDRITYLDEIQYEATQTPGVGKYNTRQRPKSSTVYQRKNDKPQQWRKKHELQNKKKQPKAPDMTSYNPKEIWSYSKKKTKQGEWDKIKRFSQSKSGSGLGPGKYIQIEDWTHKNNATDHSKSRPRSAYYN